MICLGDGQAMAEQDRWKFINDLDDELLKGGVILSEWCCFIIKDTDIAFVAGANLATIITAIAGIETHLRSEYGSDRRENLHQLIELSPLDGGLKGDLHNLRRYRHKWVHVSDPWDHQELLDQPKKYERELEDMAMAAVRALRRTIYDHHSQWI